MKGSGKSLATWLNQGASIVVLATALAASGPALAQEAPSEAGEETKPLSADTDPAGDAATVSDEAIIITGVRQALQNAQQRKRDADTVVDSITATDIGAFPDKSVAEALQRVPGITVNRFATPGDTAHFSAEPSGVIVRGLPQVRNEFNGRDVFSANSSRGLSWSDVPAELLAGVDVYKNQTADLIEGGIAGSVNLRTRVPFDATGQLIQVGAKANYGNLSKNVTPDLNAFYSNRWDTGAGEFGIMGHVAYSKINQGSENIQFNRFVAFNQHTYGPENPETVWMPHQLWFRDNEYRRERLGIAGAVQWRSNDGSILATAQYLRSLYKHKWYERQLGPQPFDVFNTSVNIRANPSNLNVRPVAAPGTSFEFDENGIFRSGVFNMTGQYWGPAADDPGYNSFGHAVNEDGIAMFNPCYEIGAPQYPGGPPCTSTAWGAFVKSVTRYNTQRNMTQDFGFNLKWEATDRLRFNFDGQYVDSTIDNYDIEVGYDSYADVGIDWTGKRPRISGLGPATNLQQSRGGLANPNNWYLLNSMDHIEDSEGDEYALRFDAEHDLGSDWLSSLHAGARISDRSQNVQYSTFNWQNIANAWTNLAPCNGIYWNMDSPPATCPQRGVTFNGYPANFYEVRPFGTSFHGGTMGEFPFAPEEFLANHGADLFNREKLGIGGFVPICERAAEMDDSCFTPNEVTTLTERTRAAYAMLKFGGENAILGGLTVRGNIGVRFVETRNSSEGFLNYPPVPSNIATSCPPTPLVPGGYTGNNTIPNSAPGTAPYPAACYLSAEDRAFASGGGEQSEAKATHKHWLPSFNLRVDFSPKTLARFAVSRALSRPDIGLLRNYMALSMSLPNANSLSDPRWVLGPGGVPTGVNPTYTASAFNPYLAPTTAWQFDLSLEHYFANVGQLSVALFHKQFDDYIQFGTFGRSVTRGGVTRQADVRGPANGDGAKIQGFEVAYQQFFDFLPGALKGLGVQANYTYVKDKGIPNANLSPTNTGDDADAVPGGIAGTLNPGALEGLSKHTLNLVGMYERGPIAARLAYNWRSSFLVTAVDCCVRLPIWQDSAGYLDGSVRFRITDNVELSLEAQNILDTKTNLREQVSDEDSPNGEVMKIESGWFRQDRRMTVGVRFRFGN